MQLFLLAFICISLLINTICIICCVKAAKEDETIILTDTDGVKFEIYANLIDGIFNKGIYREVTTITGETLDVQETITEILEKIRG